MYFERVGTVQFTPVVNGQEMAPLEFTNVLYVPGLSSNLFSVLYLTMHHSFTIFIERDTLHFVRDSKILFQAHVSPSNSAFLLGETFPVQQITYLVCEAYKAGKMHANPFPSSHCRVSKPLQLIHSDVHGPVKVPTHQGYCYWVTFIDDFSCFKAVYLLKQKSETFAAFKQFKAWAENVTGHRLGCLHVDKGGEYIYIQGV